MRFYLDEHISKAIAIGLMQRGYDIETVQEANNTGKSDKYQLTYTDRVKRVLITADSDFLAIISKEKIGHSGIIFITDQRIKPGEIIRRIDKLSAFMSQDNMKNHIQFV